MNGNVTYSTPHSSFAPIQRALAEERGSETIAE